MLKNVFRHPDNQIQINLQHILLRMERHKTSHYLNIHSTLMKFLFIYHNKVQPHRSWIQFITFILLYARLFHISEMLPNLYIGIAYSIKYQCSMSFISMPYVEYSSIYNTQNYNKCYRFQGSNSSTIPVSNALWNSLHQEKFFANSKIGNFILYSNYTAIVLYFLHLKIISLQKEEFFWMI